ncbi:MAG: hypothetical protein LBB59_02960 [Campylobacteraceae bacterium]|nr:hypothetical protein [Campylobacteraceae bacterium]
MKINKDDEIKKATENIHNSLSAQIPSFDDEKVKKYLSEPIKRINEIITRMIDNEDLEILKELNDYSQYSAVEKKYLYYVCFTELYSDLVANDNNLLAALNTTETKNLAAKQKQLIREAKKISQKTKQRIPLPHLPLSPEHIFAKYLDHITRFNIIPKVKALELFELYKQTSNLYRGSFAKPRAPSKRALEKAREMNELLIQWVLSKK